MKKQGQTSRTVSTTVRPTDDLRSYRHALYNSIKAHLASSYPALAAGITSSGLANKIILQTDPSAAADSELQSALDMQIQIERKFLESLDPKDVMNTKNAIARMVSQAHKYADQLIANQAPAQQQASNERKLFYLNMAGQTLAGIGGTIAAGGNPAGFVAGATAWDAASAKAQGKEYGAAELGQSVAINSLSTLGGMGAGHLIGKGLGAAGGAAARGAVGGLVGGGARMAGAAGHAIHQLAQALTQSAGKGIASVPHYLAMEMGPEKLAEQLVHHGVHALLHGHEPVPHPTPASLASIRESIDSGKPIMVATGAAPQATARTSSVMQNVNDMKKVAQSPRVVQDDAVVAAQKLATAVLVKMNGGVGDKISLKNLICKMFGKQVPEACAMFPSAATVQSQLVAALPGISGAQFAQAAQALGVDPKPFIAFGAGNMPANAIQAMLAVFQTKKASHAFINMTKTAEDHHGKATHMKYKWKKTASGWGLLKISQSADIEEISSHLHFMPTRKKRLVYMFWNGDEQSMPPMSYMVMRESGTSFTKLDNTQRDYIKNDIMIAGPEGERYTMSPSKFAKNYEGKIGEDVVVEQTPRMVAEYNGKESVRFTASWGQDMDLHPGDFLVKEGPGKYYRIEREVFKNTYEEPGS